MDKLQYYIRHTEQFLQKRFLLVFQSDEARMFFENALPTATFEQISMEEAEKAVRIGIHGKVIPYGYTHMLTEDEINQLSTINWERTAQILAEGNERFFNAMMKKGGENDE